MNENHELLNHIYQNSEMGVVSIRQLLEIVTEPVFIDVLIKQLKGYESINNTAKIKFQEQGVEEKDISTIAKISTYLSINFQTLFDKTPKNIGDMLIKGSNMGVVEITKNISTYKNADKSILELAGQLLNNEQQNILELKAFV